MLPGAPIRLKLPPIAEANTNGNRNLARLKPARCAKPIATGINTAAVPVLDKKPDIRPVISITDMISFRSVPANLVTIPPTSRATPVSKKAAPTMNMAMNNNTFVSTKPAKASFGDNTPVTTRPTATIIAVTDSGMRSHTNITMAKIRNSKVIVTPSMRF